MHSQSSDIQKAGGIVENQIKSSMVNNSTLKPTNNQIGTMTKRKQNVPMVLQLKNSPTTDVTVVNVHQINGTPAISVSSNSPIKHATQSKSQQMTNVRHMSSVPRAAIPRVSPNNGKTDITDDQNILSFPVYQGAYNHPPPSTTIPLSMSSPHIGSQHQNFHSNQYHNYPQTQMQIHQSHSQPSHTDIGNRSNYSNRQNNSNHANKKVFHSNYTKSKRNGNSTSAKNYNSSNNNNNNNCNNNNNNEYTIANKSTRHPNHQISRNTNRSYNCDTSKNISPQPEPYSSSSSSSSSSSVQLPKKSIHHRHSPVIPQLISPISFQGDSRTTPMTYGYHTWQHNPYVEDCQNHMNVSYEWCGRTDVYTQLGRSHQQVSYMDPSTGECRIANIVDGKRLETFIYYYHYTINSDTR